MDQQSEDTHYQDYWRQAQGANQPAQSGYQPSQGPVTAQGGSQPQDAEKSAQQPQGAATQQSYQQASYQQPPAGQPQYQPPAVQEPVVESASATTDHANNHATTTTWGVLIGGAIAVVVLCLAMSSCVSGLITTASYLYDYDYGYDSYGHGYGHDWDDFDLDDLGDYLDDSDSWPNADWGTQNPLELQESLELYLGYCDESLDLYVGASDYAGAQASVRDYVKKVCSVDNDANEQVTSLVRTALATLDANGDPSQDLGSAVAAAKDAAHEIEALPVPQDVSSSVKAELAQGASTCQSRWDTAAQALQALLDGDEISEGDWRDLLADSAVNPNNDAADDFLEALTDSSMS